jgi:hypothetical protein
MTSEPKPEITDASARCGVSELDPGARSVAERIADFLAGRTHGEELLHELYDYVLDEPVPQRLRALLGR